MSPQLQLQQQQLLAAPGQICHESPFFRLKMSWIPRRDGRIAVVSHFRLAMFFFLSIRNELDTTAGPVLKNPGIKLDSGNVSGDFTYEITANVTFGGKG